MPTPHSASVLLDFSSWDSVFVFVLFVVFNFDILRLLLHLAMIFFLSKFSFFIQTGDEMSKRSKFVFLTWVGSNVSVMKKAKMSTDKLLMKEIIQVGTNSHPHP